MASSSAPGDDAGLAMAYRLLAWSAGTACRFGDCRRGAERAVEHARRAGDVRQERRATTAYAGAASLGPTHVDEAIARCESAIEQTAGDRQSEGNLLAVLGGLYAMQGAFDQARELVSAGAALLEELGLELDAARSGSRPGAWRCSRATSMPRRTSSDGPTTRSRRRGEQYTLSTSRAAGQTLLERDGPLDEALAICDRSRELASDGDIATQALWRSVRGRILARTGAVARRRASVRRRSRSSNPPMLRSCGARRTSISAKCSSQRVGSRRRARRYEAARALAEERAAS